MPLLGRHKSLVGPNNTSGQPAGGATNQKQPVCESPLFGIRRQLPIAKSTNINGSGGNQQQQQRQQPISGMTHNYHNATTRHAAESKLNTTTNDELGSIPTQITRQQIHYAFSIMDTNSDGLIDVRDLSQMLANLGVPIDEAILSHVMSTVSKRGDHLISEAEFLVWIGKFIPICETQQQLNLSNQNESINSNRTNRQNSRLLSSSSSSSSASSSSSTSPWRSMVRSSTAGSSLAAQSTEVPPPGANLRQRRGSGSGLALMRSLSGSKQQQQQSAERTATKQTGVAAESAASADDNQQQQQQQLADLEALNDLRAAFCVFDLDGDGYITLDEVRKGLSLLGESWTPNELSQLFSKCSPTKQQQKQPDLTRQSRISIDDFVRLLL